MDAPIHAATSVPPPCDQPKRTRWRAPAARSGAILPREGAGPVGSGAPTLGVGGRAAWGVAGWSRGLFRAPSGDGAILPREGAGPVGSGAPTLGVGGRAAWGVAPYK
jgi:hypothetical protein